MSISQYYYSAIATAEREIKQTYEEELLHTDSEQVARYYFNKYELPLIQKDNTREIEVRKGKSLNEEIHVEISYPIIVEKGILDVPRSKM